MSISEDALSLLRVLHEMEDDDVDAVALSEHLRRETGRDDLDEVQRILDPYVNLYVEVVSSYRAPGEGQPARNRYRLTDEGRRLFDLP